MRELAGKTAFVTGGASGIGFALGRAFAEAGMNVMLADIETDALAAAVESLHDFGPDVRGVTCDVADPASVEHAAKASYEAFGNVHVVCNNAGVGGGSGIDDISLDTWRWVLDVNLMGVAARHPDLPAAHPRPRRRRPHRQHRVHGRDEQRARVQPLRGEQVRGGQHVGGAGDAAEAAWHRRDRALSRVRANPHQRRAGAIGRSATVRRGRPTPQARPASWPPRLAETRTVRARPVGCRRAGSHRDPRGRTLRVHASGDCATRWRSGLPPSWRRWTRRRLARG